jgi:hypothetical protein
VPSNLSGRKDIAVFIRHQESPRRIAVYSTFDNDYGWRWFQICEYLNKKVISGD